MGALRALDCGKLCVGCLSCAAVVGLEGAGLAGEAVWRVGLLETGTTLYKLWQQYSSRGYASLMNGISVQS